MKQSTRLAHDESRLARPVGEPGSSQGEEILAWENIGDDLWLPRRVRGSHPGGALG